MNNRLAITTRITRWGLQKPLTYGLLFCALLFSTNTLAVGGITIDHFPPRFDNGQNQTDLEDMRVKVLGGYVRITRRWMGSEWDWNRRWNDLEIPWAEYEDDPLVIHAFAVSSGGSGGSGSSAIVSGPIVDSLRTAITRNGQAYVRRYGTNTFENGSTRTITKTDSGYTWKDRRGNKIYYNGDGQMTSYADRNGIKVSVVRSGDYIQSIKDHHGNVVISYTWEDVPGDDGAKRLAKLQDYSGRSVIYGWNTSNQLEQVTDVLGEAWLYSYASGFQQTDPEGRVTSYSISGNGRLSGYHNADGVGFNYGYRYDDDTKQYYVSKTDATGVVTEKWHNSHGIVERKDINGETQFTAEVVLSNDSRGTEDYVDQYKRLAISSSSSGGGSGGRISGVPTTPDFGLQDPIYVKSKTVTDARGNKTIYNYDRWRNVTKRTNPDGTTVVSSFNTAYGLPLVVTDERGIVTDYAYDGNGNLKTLTEAKGTGDQRITR
ncbi:MAG: RHS repeat protein, partial [Gammaproteobacteria bacterium]|nr:RHS repeat protein [Gammaproteobacteria bacterium]